MNAKTQHAPGSWNYDAPYIVAPDPSGVHADIYIAEIVYQDSEGRIASEEHQDANARLIAAAPDLLDALGALLEQVEQEYASQRSSASDVFSAVGVARATIAKATGAAS